MNQIEISKELNLKAGEIFTHVNGGEIRVSRLTEKSVFVQHHYSNPDRWSNENRESFNSVKTYINKGRWIRGENIPYKKTVIYNGKEVEAISFGKI